MGNLMKTLLYAMGTEPLPEEVQAMAETKEAIRAAHQRLSYEEFEELWNAITNLERACDLDTFTLGFRLGVQMTLEGLRPLDCQPS